MQNVTISIEESTVDKVMYLLRNLWDVQIISKEDERVNVLDSEIAKRVESYKSGTIGTISFDVGLDKVREKIVTQL